MQRLDFLKIRSQLYREVIAELLGTFILVLLGDSVMATIFTGRLENIAGVVGPLGWGLSVYVAVNVCNTVSTHLNPAVTLSLATIGKFPMYKVPMFFSAQYLGAFLGAATVFAVYKDALDNHANGYFVDGPNGTAAIFTCIPKEFVSTSTAFFDQIVGTAVLLIAVESVGDPRRQIPTWAQPAFVGGIISCIIFALSFNTMAPLNPARDVSPRLFAAAAGYGGQVLSYRGADWLIFAVLGPHVGGILGVWIYKLCLDIHAPEENRKDSYDITDTIALKSVHSNPDSMDNTHEK